MRNGKTDLALFQQLFYVVIATLGPVIASGHISMIIQGNFPQVRKILRPKLELNNPFLARAKWKDLPPQKPQQTYSKYEQVH